MIENLRLNEEVLLYGNVIDSTQSDREEVVRFLEREYNKEIDELPADLPKFNAEAALWAAMTVYITAQLILFRENKEKDLASLLPEFRGTQDLSAILSADLCLRFLPVMIMQLKNIDSEDGLIPILEKTLENWHYSGLFYQLDFGKVSFENITENTALYQLYIDRIIDLKNAKLAQHPHFKSGVLAAQGDYSAIFWKELKQN